MNGLEIDFETRSDVDLKKHGSHRYFSSPHTRPLMASYILNGAPVKRWRPGQPCPPEIVAHVEAGGIVSAHNNSFERQLWQMILTPRYGWPALRLEQCRCTAATAAAMALPRDLAGVGAALGLTVQKDKAGHALIRKFSMPRRPRKGEDPDGLYFNEPEDHPEDFERFHDYCDVDVITEAGADARMIPLSDVEQELYLLNERINDRGVRIDIASAHAALRLADKSKALLDVEIREITKGHVGKASEISKLTEWLEIKGFPLDSLAKAELEDLLVRDDLPDDVRRAIEIRQEYGKTSVSKLKAMIDRASDDDRVRGTSIFCGAGTGRFQSVGVNFYNMPRPRNIFDDAHLDRRILFENFQREDPDLLRFMYGDTLGRPLHLISDAIRGFVWAAPGHELLQADYSGIEGAVAAWVSDELWKVDAMHEIIADPVNKPDMYRRTAAGIMNLSTEVVTKKHPLRQSVGKVSELSLGYQGGVGAFYSMSKNYGVKLAPLFEPVWEAADEERREKAAKRYENEVKRGKTAAARLLTREAWIACEIIKVGWRATNPQIAGAWKHLENAARDAVREPGTAVSTLGGRITYKVAHGFLWCRLPSGRCLAYGAPRLRDQVWAKVRLADGSWSASEVMDREEAERGVVKGTVRIEGETSPKVTALGVESYKFVRFALYGGLAFENVVQAIARDLLVNGMFRAEAAGFPIVSTVYDEIICEVPHGFGDLAAFERDICVLPEWAKIGSILPLTAGGWRGKRYRKE